MGNTKYLKPGYVRKAWDYLLDYLDRSMKQCKVKYGDKDNYEIKEHSIHTATKWYKMDMVRGMLKMIIHALVPAARRVIYENEECILITEGSIMDMSVKMTYDIFKELNTENMKEHVEREKKKLARRMLPDRKAPISREDLRYLYYEKGMTQKQIGEIIGVTQRTVHYWMVEYDLPRNPGRHVSSEVLYRLYYEKDYTLDEMARILEIDKGTLITKMDEYGFKRRDKAFYLPCESYKRAFASTLRKKFRRNPVYIEVAEEMVKWAKDNPDIPVVSDEW